ncbi:MAG TPA: hypothetical protein VMU33_01900 [Burkholderiaceae bacterium]|nr:hypothetical protein [Burkholderiaceae bacterium]
MNAFVKNAAAVVVALALLNGAARAQGAEPRNESPRHALPVAAATLSTLVVDGPDGTLFHFEYLAGQGWKFAGASSPLPAVQVATSDRSPGAVAALVTATQSRGRFVDRSTGYAFEWRQGEGWQYAGQASEEERGTKSPSGAAPASDRSGALR